MSGSETEKGKIYSFQEGVEKRERAKSIQAELKKRINEIVKYRESLADDLNRTFDSTQRQTIRDRLQQLSDMALQGAELLGTLETEKIQAFLDEDYQALK